MTWCYRLAALAVAVALVGCSSNDSGGAGGSGSGGGGEGANSGAAVSFSDPSPLTVAPGQAIQLHVETDPPGAYRVSFLLLGDSLDASLDRAASPTDESGGAGVTLLAPSKAASFKVRAAVGDEQSGLQGEAEIEIQVSERGIGSLRIIPDYQGNREITEWHAAVVPQARCEDFAPPDAPEGADVVEAPFGEDLVLDDATVGPNLAVLVRSERKVWGCAETTLTHAGEEKEITVPVLDRPVDLTSAALDVTLFLSEPPPDLELVLRAADDQLIDAAFPEGEEPAAVLLDAMRPQLPTEVHGLFDEARDADLEAAVAASFVSREIDVRALLEELLRAGRPLQPSFLRGRLSSAEADATHALLRVESLGGVDSARAGVPADHLVSFVANPGDTVVIGAESGILFLPTRLVGALAEDAALDDDPDGGPFSSTLAAAVGCAEIGTVVGPLGDCDVACVEAACRLGLGDIWSASVDTSADNADLGVFTVVLSGQGVVDADAALIGLDVGADNSWVGELHAADRAANIGGTAIALEADDDETNADDADGEAPAGSDGSAGSGGGSASGAGGSGGDG